MEALAHRGRPQAALATLQARSGGLGIGLGSTQASSSSLTLQQAQVALQVYLDCGSMAEAFLEVGLQSLRLKQHLLFLYALAGLQSPCDVVVGFEPLSLTALSKLTMCP